MRETPRKIQSMPVHNKPQEGFNPDNLFKLAEIIAKNPKKSDLVKNKIVTANQLESIEEGTAVPEVSKLSRFAEVLGIELSVLQEALDLYHEAAALEKKKYPKVEKKKIVDKHSNPPGGSTGRRSGFRHAG